jgi:16S rRNA (cytidine1402-2'-O)-methyltransferase
MGTLFLVGTPIGNLEDITLRALQTLRDVALIAAEDTRTARRLLDRYEISTQVCSYYEHSKLFRLDHVLAVLDEGDVALISEAGMPGISDPGYELVRAALEQGHHVVPVPGPSATLSALIASGLPTDRFLYLGFLPRRRSARGRVLEGIAGEPGTLLAFESPHRLRSTLDDILEVLGDRPIAICRELTKLHEEIWRGTVKDAVQWCSEKEPRGEYTLVIAGHGARDQVSSRDAQQVLAAVMSLMRDGVPRPTAIKAVAKLSGWRKRDLYELVNRRESREE